MPHSSYTESCNHHHFSPRHPFLGNYPGTDAITNPVNVLRYPANAMQLLRAISSGVRAVMVFSGTAALPIVSGISAVASLPIFLINNLTNSVINYTEQQGVLPTYADVAKTQQQDENHHHHHRHLPKPIQALFHSLDSGYRYMAEKFTPQNPQNLAKLKTCLFYGNLALSATITALGVVALVGGVGAVAATPVGWGLIGLSAVSAVTFVGYSAVKNKYTTLSRQAYQEAFHLNEETKKILQDQGQNIEATYETYGLLEPSQVVTQSFSSYLGLNKPKKLINYLARKNNSSQENPTTVSEVLLNSALLNFVATSNLEEQEKKDIVKTAQEKFKPKDNFSGSIDLKIVDSNEFLYEIATFLAKKEVEKIKDALDFGIDDDIKAVIPLWQEKTLQAENSKNTFSSRSLALLQPKSKKYYDSYIQAQQLLAFYRIVRQELPPKNTLLSCHVCNDQPAFAMPVTHRLGRDSQLNLQSLFPSKCCDHGHSHSHGHESHSHSHDHDGGCCSQPAFAMPADIEKFKLQLPSYVNPNLYNGNRYLDVLNRKLFGKGAQDSKLTLRGVKELTKKTAESVRHQILEIATMSQILAIVTEENKIPNEGASTNAQSQPTTIIKNPSIDANTCCGFGLC